MPNFCETTIGWGFVVPADLIHEYLLKSWRDGDFIVQIDEKAIEDREPTRDQLFLTADSWILTDFTLRLPSHEQGKTALIGITNLIQSYLPVQEKLGVYEIDYLRQKPEEARVHAWEAELRELFGEKIGAAAEFGFWCFHTDY